MKKKLLLLYLLASTFFTHAQNVGIGTTTPVQKLHVEGASFLNGNVGIGINNPLNPLHVNGVSLFTPGGTNIQILDGNKIQAFANGGLNLTTYSNDPIKFTTNTSGGGFGGERMRILGNGKVGIGTSTPGSMLHVVSGASGYVGDYFSGITLESNGDTYFNLLVPNSNETGVLFGKASDAASGGIVYNHTETLNGLQFRTNGNSTRMVLDQNGNVGIGNTNPEFLLDLNNRMRIRSGGSVSTSAGVWLNKTDNSVSQAFVGIEDDNYVGIYGTVPGWSFGMNTTNGNVKVMGRLGIGTSTPGFPLSFPNSTGDKISLWSDGGATHYGLGIQAGLLQVFTPANNAHIAFGYGSSSSFTETMRIQGNGNVGIGNSDPAYRLDISNRMRIRSGGDNNTSAGLYLNNNANNLAAFIGMEDDTHVGFFGTVAGWKFSMNTQTGGLKINGTEGQAGQVLISNGNSAAANFTTLGNVVNSYIKTSSSSIGISNIGAEFHLPQISQSITLARKSRLLISANISFQGFTCIGCVNGIGFFNLKVNGAVQTYQVYCVGSSTFGNASICNFIVELNAGTHLIDFYIYHQAGQGHYAYPLYSSIVVLPVD